MKLSEVELAEIDSLSTRPRIHAGEHEAKGGQENLHGVRTDSIQGIQGETQTGGPEMTDINQFFKDVLIAIAGAVCTPEKGYSEDGGLGLLLADVKLLRKQHDELERERDEAERSVAHYKRWLRAQKKSGVKLVPPPPAFTPAVYRAVLRHDPVNDCHRFIFRYGAYAVVLDEHGCAGGAGFFDTICEDHRSIERIEWPWTTGENLRAQLAAAEQAKGGAERKAERLKQRVDQQSKTLDENIGDLRKEVIEIRSKLPAAEIGVYEYATRLKSTESQVAALTALLGEVRTGLENIRDAVLIKGLYHGGETYCGLSSRLQGYARDLLAQIDAMTKGEERG